MNYAIFCLLAFSVFDVVFSGRSVNERPDELEQELMDLRDIHLNRMHEILFRRRAAIDLFDEAERKGIKNEDLAVCWEAYEAHSNPADDEYAQCSQCHKRATENRDIELAKTCCINNIAAAEVYVELIIASVKECTANLLRLAEAARNAACSQHN